MAKVPQRLIRNMREMFDRPGISPEERARIQRAIDSGREQVFYHGTDRLPLNPRTLAPGNEPGFGAEFEAFEPQFADLGFHVGTDEQANMRLLDRLGKRSEAKPFEHYQSIMPLAVRIERPLSMSDVGAWDDPYAVALEMRGVEPLAGYRDAIDAELEYMDRYDYNPSAENLSQLAALRDIIKRAGYDSIVYRNAYENLGDMDPGLKFEYQQELADLEAQAEAMANRGFDTLSADELRQLNDVHKRRQQLLGDDQYLNSPYSHIIFDPAAIRSIYAQFDPRYIDDPGLSKAKGGIVRSSLRDLMDKVRNEGGDFSARRLERAADEVPNLEQQYSPDALLRTFAGDTSQPIMTMDPSQFERFAYPLNEKLAASQRTRDYINELAGIARRDGYSSVPHLGIRQPDPRDYPMIVGHEGRHRTRALTQLGDQSTIVRAIPGGRLHESFDRRDAEEYLEQLMQSLMKFDPEGVRVYPEFGEDGSLIKLPEMYAGGGQVEEPCYQFEPFDHDADDRQPFAKGGAARKARQWLKDVVESDIKRFYQRTPAGTDPERALAELQASMASPEVQALPPGTRDAFERALRDLQAKTSLNSWLGRAATKYIKRDYGTEWDPLSQLTVRHVEGDWPPVYDQMFADTPRRARGIESEPVSRFIDPADTYHPAPFRDKMLELNPWMSTLPLDEQVYTISNADELNIRHLVDELRNAMNPESGLPAQLRIRPESLQRMSFPQASELVGKINQWRAEQKAAANAALANNAATKLFKEYPEGYRWVELAPTDDGDLTALEQALKYEGEMMGHCVGGYCPDVSAGRSRIYSLRDPQGQPHVTIEASPDYPIRSMSAEEVWDDMISKGLIENPSAGMDEFFEDYETNPEAFWAWVEGKHPQRTMSIDQIKGKQNAAPVDKYLPYVQDFISSGNWNKIGDWRNARLIPRDQAERMFLRPDKPYESVFRAPEGIDSTRWNMAAEEAIRRQVLPKYATPDQFREAAMRFLPSEEEAAQIDHLFGGKPDGMKEGGKVKDKSMLDELVEAVSAGAAGFGTQITPDKRGNIGLVSATLSLPTLAALAPGGEEYVPEASWIASEDYDQHLNDMLARYGLSESADLDTLDQFALAMGETLGQIPLLPASALIKLKAAAPALFKARRVPGGKAIDVATKPIRAAAEYFSPTAELSPAMLGTGTLVGGGMREYFSNEDPETDNPEPRPLTPEEKERLSKIKFAEGGPVYDAGRVSAMAAELLGEQPIEMAKGGATRGRGKVSKPAAKPTELTDAEKARISRQAMGVQKAKRRVGTTGQYVGAPAGVDSPQALAAMRKRYMDDVLAGIEGREWYGDSSDWIRSVTGGDDQSDQLARILGVTSQGTGVDTNLGFAVTGINQRAAGEPVRTGRFPGNQSPLIEGILSGQVDTIGPKREPFARNLSVSWRPELATHPVHDIWQGRAFGYTHPDGKPWDAGFSPQQHAFMDEEMETMMQQMNERGAGGFTDWDALRGQAAAWTGAKLRAGDIAPGEAAKHYGSFAPKYVAAATHEQAPAAGAGHLEEILSLPYEDRLAFQMDPRSSWLDDRGRDRLYSSAGMLVEPSRSMIGAYTPAGGTLEINPGEVAYPLIQTAEGSVTPRDRQLMDIMESSRAYIDAQNAGAWNRVVPPSQVKGGDMTSLNIGMAGSPTPESMAALSDLANKYGMFAVDTGRGVNLINDPWSDLGAARTGASLGKDLRGAMGQELRSIVGDADYTRAKIDTGYQSYQDALREPGKGMATRQFIEMLESNPVVMKNVEPVLRDKARANMLRDIEYAQSRGMAVRPDIQEARRILADEGLDGLRAALKAGKVLPAIAAAAVMPLLTEEPELELYD